MLIVLISVIAGLGAIAKGALPQDPLGSPVHAFAKYDTGLFSPLEDLGALSQTQYTVLTHPVFPQHSVRIKESQFCDGGVRAFTGYIDTEARHLFFYFFESRRDPKTDDIIMWTNGGPGSSSALGLFMELGPCRVTGPNSTERFQYSWNEHTNIFFIDQPVGVGFSYADYGEYVTGTIDAARDIAAFTAVFFEHFIDFKGRPFHMAGESYAGRYLPVYASAVHDQNAMLVDAGLTAVNLASVIIGNGATDFLKVVLALYDMFCIKQRFPFPKGISECVQLKQIIPRCERRFNKYCHEIYDDIECSSAFQYCFDTMWKTFDHLNPYDATRPCHDKPDSADCYPRLQDIEVFLNDPVTQSALGIDHAHANFSVSNTEINLRILGNSDVHNFRAEHYLEALLERGVRVLVYAGTNDFAANWVGNERMTLALEWSSQDSYRSASVQDWYVGGSVAGWRRSGGNLTFATVYDAGHLVPFDQPVRALELINRWLAAADL